MLPSDPSAMMRGELSGFGQRKLLQAGAVGVHPADAVARALGEPERAVRGQRDGGRSAAGIRQRELGERRRRSQSSARSAASHRC